MKKFLALILAVLMIAGSAVSVAAFDDVSGKYAEAIDGLQETGIVAGTSETTFTPDALVTRWQMALFMARAASAITDDAEWAEGAKIFSDCTNYLGAIQYCFGRGIIKGVTTTEFAPDNNILFRDGIIMAIRALGYEKEDEGLADTAKKYNKTGAAYWTPYYERAIELGLLENLGNVAVDKALTRAETAQLIYNMIYTPVYAKDGANTNNYTLYDVAFGGKAIVEVENSKNAWVYETPKFFFETNTLADDAESIIIAWNTEDGIETDEVTFDELTKWGIDVENVDDLFAATLEIINYEEDDVANYEYLTNFEANAAVELTYADVKLAYATDDSFKYAKIGSKTHYAADAEAKNTIAVYVVDKYSDDAEEITYKEIALTDLDGLYYDLTAYDVDGDNYYEIAYASFYNMDVYKNANTKGQETFGEMKNLKNVVYTEDLAEGEVFVYTFDLATKTVDVKYVVEELTGTVTSYKETKVDGETIGYITIDDVKYTIEADVTTALTTPDGFTAINVEEAADLMDEASKIVGETWTFYALEGKILELVAEVEEEEEAVKYLVLKDFTDFELYDYVVMDAYIEGEEESIKVRTIKNGDKTVEFNKLSYTKLAKELEGLFGIYSYTVNADGYYTLTVADFEYKVSDFVTGNSMTFKDGIITNGKTVGLAEGVNKRNVMLRINSATTIYLIDVENETVSTAKAKASGEFKIDVDASTMFYADKIGYGSNDEDIKADAITWEHGVASVIYIKANEDAIAPDAIDTSAYKLIFVQEDITTKEIGTDAGFKLPDADDDAETVTSYTKYTFDGNAYLLATFAEVDEVYVEDAKNANLVAGVYLLDGNNIAVGSVALDAISIDNVNVIQIPETTQAFGFIAVNVAKSNIDLYNWGDIRIWSNAKTSNVPALGPNGMYNGNNITVLPFAPDFVSSSTNVLQSNILTLKFMEITAEEEDGEIVYGTKIYEAKKDAAKSTLMTYIDEQEDDTITVIMAANAPAGKTNAQNQIVWMSGYSPVASNTLTGIIIDNIYNATPARPELDQPAAPTIGDNFTIYAQGAAVYEDAETVEVTINFAKNPGVTCLGFFVNFDASKLTYKSVAYGSIFAQNEITLGTNDVANGSIYVSANNSVEDKTANGKLVTFTFELADGVEAGDVTIEVAKDEGTTGGVYNVAEDEIAYDVINGNVVIAAIPAE